MLWLLMQSFGKSMELSKLEAYRNAFQLWLIWYSMQDETNERVYSF